MPLRGMRSELLTELVTKLPEKSIKRRAGLGRDFLLGILTVVVQQCRVCRAGYFDPHRNDSGLHLGNDVGKTDWTLHPRFSSARRYRSY